MIICMGVLFMSALKAKLSSHEKFQGQQNIYYLALDRKSWPAPLAAEGQTLS